MCDNNYHPLPLEYLQLLRETPRIQLAIMGKDPYPTDPVGIPFCKPDWESQFKGNCSGAYVLRSLGFNDAEVQQQYANPQQVFSSLANRGVVFLNLSYHYIGKQISRTRNATILQQASIVNIPILVRSEHIVLCGEAQKNEWFGGERTTKEKVVHPDIRNKNHPDRSAEWMKWWSQNALKNRFDLSI